MAIQKTLTTAPKPKPTDESKLGFGKIYSDHMFKWNYSEGNWHDPRIEPFGPMLVSPAMSVLHYGQEIFEGMKAYRRKDGGVNLFRPFNNFERLNRSADRMCIPNFPVETAVEGIAELVKADKDWVPSTKGASLYLRPNIIATDEKLGVTTSQTYLFYIIGSPSGPYYANGLAPTSIYVEDEYVRAVRGGTGAAKTAGNYAGSILAGEKAHKAGYDQVLWLDGVEMRYIEEVGSSNIFFMIDDVLVTPKLNGSILSGITRDSTIQLAKDMGIKVEEKHILLEELIEAQEKGRLQESFATGTAAVISPVGKLGYKDKEYLINGGKMGEVASRMYDTLTGIQYGEIEDPHGWVYQVV